MIFNKQHKTWNHTLLNYFYIPHIAFFDFLLSKVLVKIANFLTYITMYIRKQNWLRILIYDELGVLHCYFTIKSIKNLFI